MKNKKQMTKCNEKVNKAVKFMKVKKALLTTYATYLMLDLSTMVVQASGASGSADTMWGNFIDFIIPWVQRIGGATAFIGGVAWAEGYLTDQTDHKQKGFKAVIAGCIIFALATAGKGLFLA